MFPNPVYSEHVLQHAYRDAQAVLFEPMLDAHDAHAVMLAECDVISVENAAALARAVAAIRAAVDIPLDIYVEVPDNFGGFIRHYEIAEIIRVAAPVYIKFGLRNAPDVYPSGSHLESTVIALSRERVRRAEIGLAHLHRYGPEAVISAPGAADLGIPQPAVV